ncbi:MAG: ABC transporter ATP-binding protein [Candidatus Heimdallarchaeota archaeon]|nr:MAG: ABC transporter ATP-binding protein [Candidatus Heimdallarchaeota archaeon]
MLRIQNLTVEVKEEPGKVILRNLNLSVPEGEIHVLFGPNGSGKSTLIQTIMGFPQYHVVQGSILFKGINITGKSITERAKMGIGISFQRPPNVPGLKLNKVAEFLVKSQNETTAEIGRRAKELEMRDFLERDLNVHFSGGEIKRSELLQLLLQDPDFLLLDEPESGVDIQAMKLIGKMTNALLGTGPRQPSQPWLKKKAGLVITHTGHILDYIHTDKAHVMCQGHIGCTGTPSRLLEDIRNLGYPECIRCHERLDDQLQLKLVGG